MKLLFTSPPPRNGHMLFCDGNFCKPIKDQWPALRAHSHSCAAVKQQDVDQQRWQSNHTQQNRVCLVLRTDVFEDLSVAPR